jgi:hypothetical protein
MMILCVGQIWPNLKVGTKGALKMTSRQFVILIQIIKELGIMLSSIKGLSPDLTNRDVRAIEAYRARFKEKCDAYTEAYKNSEAKEMQRGATLPKQSKESKKGEMK